MQKSLLFKILIPVLLLSLATGPALPAGAQADGQTRGAAMPANAPWTIGWVDQGTSASVGSYSSVAYNPVDNLSYVTYYDGANQRLVLASPVQSGGNCGGGKWWCRVVDGTGGPAGSSKDSVGTHSSLDFWRSPSGYPWKLGIAYHDATTHGLKYAVWTQVSRLSGNWDFQTIQSSTNPGFEYGQYNSLKFNEDGYPRIAFHSYNPIYSYLVFAYWVGSGGNCGEGADLDMWRCDTVDYASGLAMGEFASLAIDYSGGIAFAYYDGANGNLKYAYYNSMGGGNCGSGSNYFCSVIDGAAANVGRSAVITPRRSPIDVHRIAYYDRTNGKLKFAFQNSTNANCGAGKWFCMNVDNIGANLDQVGISMALDKQGSPIIAYMDASDAMGPAVLSLVRPAGAYGLIIGNCGDGMPNSLFYYWQCSILDNASYGQGKVDLANYTSVAVSATGLATVVYDETDGYNYTHFLKFATQWVKTFVPLVVR